MSYVIRTLICILFVVFISCKKDPAVIKFENLNGNEISILGHGGMGVGFKYPMDSDESLNTCLSIGADGTECDIQMSLDTVLIIYHDDDLSEKTICNGIIADKLWSDFWGCHYASPYSSKLNILSLKEWYASIKKENPNAIITLDCKLKNSSVNYESYKRRFAGAVSDFISENSIYGKVNVESSDIKFLELLKTYHPSIRTFYYTDDINFAITHSNILTGVTINNDIVTATDIKLLHTNKLQVALFGMYGEKDNAPAIEKSPDFVQCDKIIEMLRIFKKYKN